VVTKSRLLWILVTALSAAVSSYLVLRRFQSDLSAFRVDMETDKRLIAALAKGISLHLGTANHE